MKLSDHRSILGIDPTKRGFAFVFFERGELMDWGARTCARETHAAVAFLETLDRGYAADIVVLEDPDAAGNRRRTRIRTLLRAVLRRLEGEGVTSVRVSRAKVRERWRAKGFSTKQLVALNLATRFPELEHLVPPPRKVFMDEDERLQIFDALTLVLHAIRRTDRTVGR